LGTPQAFAKRAQLDMHSLKTALHFVFLAFQERTRTKQERHRAKNVIPTSTAKMPALLHVTVVLPDGRLILPVPNVRCVVLVLLVMIVNLATQESIAVALITPLNASSVLTDGRLILPAVPNVPNVTQVKQEKRVNFVKQACTVVLA
jgi:hypothetical protein